MLKEIFNNIEGEWDHFEVAKVCIPLMEVKKRFNDSDEVGYRCIGCEKFWSLPDLLANKSFTDACGLSRRTVSIAFDWLWREGQAPALKYILDTMIKKAV